MESYYMVTSRPIRTKKNEERARDIMNQVEKRLEFITMMNEKEHATFIIEAYYEVIKELLTALLALEGYKCLDHKCLVKYPTS